MTVVELPGGRVRRRLESSYTGITWILPIALAVATVSCGPDNSDRGQSGAARAESVTGCGFGTGSGRSSTGGASFSDPHVIATEVDNVYSIYAGDLDGDGDQDVIYNSDEGHGVIGWVSNNGNAQFSREPSVTNSFQTPLSRGADVVVVAVDMDGDEDLDVLYGYEWSYHVERLEAEIAWYRNQGAGEFTLGGTIDRGPFWITDISVVDLDDDGDLDVLTNLGRPGSTGDEIGHIVWYENLGEGAFTSSRKAAYPTNMLTRVIGGDLNGDASPDILAAGDSAAWYENQGSGAFSPERMIPMSSEISQISCGDMDGDGDADVISGGRGIVWHENLGRGEFADEQVVVNEVVDYPVFFVRAADLDGDGDMDVLSGTYNTIVWYENDGGGTFTDGQVLTEDANYLTALVPLDMDGDGDLDVLYGSEGRKDEIGWIENLGQREVPDADGSANAVGSSAASAPATVFRDQLSSGGEGPLMVVIPAGRFTMGCDSSNSDDCRRSEEPVHDVVISTPFALSAYEVTFEDYDRYTHPESVSDRGWGRGTRPAIRVTWSDAQGYVEWLSAQTGERYQLPSEAQWEYAVRAGTTTKYNWGDEVGINRANCDGCGSQWDGLMTAPVGSFAPNRFGLYDMHGNVEEWVEDCWNSSYRRAPTDGSAWLTGDCKRRVFRGGSWGGAPRHLRATSRGFGSKGIGGTMFGLRVARTLTSTD